MMLWSENDYSEPSSESSVQVKKVVKIEKEPETQEYNWYIILLVIIAILLFLIVVKMYFMQKD